MDVIIMSVIVTVVVVVFGGGIGYLIWLKSRPKKETWNCNIYKAGIGLKKFVIKDGVSLKLQDIIPFKKDVIEKIDTAPGITIYRLQKLKRTTPSVSEDVVDLWPNGEKWVNAVLHGESVTLLKKSYDQITGQLVFQPMNYDRVNFIQNEMTNRKNRLRSNKDILEAISPWIVAAILMIGLVSIGWAMGESYVKVAQLNGDMVKYSSDKLVEMEKMRQGYKPVASNLGAQYANVSAPVVEGG